MKAVLAALTLLLAVATAAPAMTEGLLKDREALLALKDACTSYGQSKLASWRPTGNPCFPKPWAHVYCAGGRVTEVNLANRQVVGVLPAKLRLAQNLVTLNLEGNRFTGNISDAWAGKNSFSRLQTLNLANNDLSGTLPNWNRLGAWRSLQSIDLSNNKFYGGLPASWLGKQRPLRNVRYLDLSNNRLGQTAAGGDLAAWCPDEAAASLSTGSGWCPTGTPIAGTVASLVSLDLSNNGFKGQLPEKWPQIFKQLQYLQIQFNDLFVDVATNPSVLPSTWTAAGSRGFQSLSMLTLYPGNDAICSVPSLDGGFDDVNLDATYQVADANDEVYTGDNPRLCPTEFVNDNKPTGVTFPTGRATVAITYATDGPIWGFKVTFWGQDAEGGEWTPLVNWNAQLIRIYTDGEDGFKGTDVTAQGMSCGSGTCTLTIANIADPYVKPVFGSEYSAFKVEVAVVNLDGVDSTTKSALEA